MKLLDGKLDSNEDVIPKLEELDSMEMIELWKLSMEVWELERCRDEEEVKLGCTDELDKELNMDEELKLCELFGSWSEVCIISFELVKLDTIFSEELWWELEEKEFEDVYNELAVDW